MTLLAIRNLAFLIAFAVAVAYEFGHRRRYAYRVRRWFRRRQRAKARALDPRTDAQILAASFTRTRNEGDR